MRTTLRILGVFLALLGIVTVVAWILSERLGAATPGLYGSIDLADFRRALWIATGALYAAAGLLFIFLRVWGCVAVIVIAIVSAASLVYDMAAFPDRDMLSVFGAARIRSDLFSLLTALALTAFTVPLARVRILT